MPQGVIHYYRQMADRYGRRDGDFKGVQEFYRLFRAPGVGHCGGGNGPQPQNLFGALVNWVEKGQAPATILAQTITGGTVTRSRPLCPYPQTAIYRGTGSTDDATNFVCSGNLDTRAMLCNGVLVKYKHEANGPLDYRDGEVDRRACLGRAHGHHGDGDHDD
jgi:feruloyl esterase